MHEEQAQALEQLYKKGWVDTDDPFSLEKTWETLNHPKIVENNLRSWGLSFLTELSNTDLPFPLATLLTSQSIEVKNAGENFKQLFAERWNERLRREFPETIKFGSIKPVEEEESPGIIGGLGDAKTQNPKDRWLILLIARFLGEPKIIRMEASAYRLRYPTERYEEFLKAIEEGQTGYSNLCESPSVYLVWDEAFLKLNLSYDGFVLGQTLKVKKEHQQTIQQALRGKVVQRTKNAERQGRLLSNYMLSKSHREKQLLKAETNELVKSGRDTKVLIKGVPGTGKTEWVLSYITEELAPRGFFTYFLDPHTVQEFTPHSGIARVCLVINEVDN
ncbi:MAG: hypothetical protein ABEK59_08040, partial [Halobacteria archaeon]